MATQGLLFGLVVPRVPEKSEWSSQSPRSGKRRPDVIKTQQMPFTVSLWHTRAGVISNTMISTTQRPMRVVESGPLCEKSDYGPD